MTVKQVREQYPFKSIFINGVELYYKDNSMDNKKVKNIKTKDWLFNTNVIMIEI